MLFARESGLFVPPSAEVLQQPAQPVTEELIASGGVERIVKKMEAASHVGAVRRLVGIAAPQVGEPYCIIALNPNLGQPDKPQQFLYFYNPTFEPLDQGMYDDNEGCFSCEGVLGWGPRYRAIELKSDNHSPLILVDDPIHQWPRIPARVAQHEIDHVNGVLWPDRLIQGMLAGKLALGSLWWKHDEHDKKMVEHMARARQGQAQPWWPHGITIEHWQQLKAKRIRLPRPEEIAA